MDEKWFDEMESRIPRGKVRTRFAPSPTGYMHVGGVRTALYTWLIARKAGGTFILRIEDTDQGRFVEGATEIIYSSLRDAGLTWDEGPDVGGPVGPYIQTERKGLYLPYARRLVERGAAYYCFCEKAEDSSDFGRHDDPCRELTADEVQKRLDAGCPWVIRQKIPVGGSTSFTDEIFGEISAPNDDLDDQVLIKGDGLPTYNFANVIDDHLMGITHVVRGTEYLSSTPKYNHLYRAFGWDVPKYIHCSPVMRDAQHKLSKRNGDPTYDDLLAAGYLREAIINYVALLGWSPGGEREIYSLEELVEAFDIKGLSKSPAIFDLAKLTWLNSEYIRAMTPEGFHAAALPYIEAAAPGMDSRLIASLLHQRCEKLTDIAGQIDFLAGLGQYDDELFVNKKSKSDRESSVEMLSAAIPAVESIDPWNADSVHDTLIGLAEKLEVKNAKLLWPVRIALSGRAVTPGGAVEICCLLGKDESLRRMRAALERLESNA
ncbi:MAG: glutamate--tRNA ligase [Oscillospiraceae bacterium]|nr:glutamate--tRNA ligase [Oscillospiraceae bacterium]